MTQDLNPRAIAELMLAAAVCERGPALKSEYARENQEGVHDLDVIFAIERPYTPEALAASLVAA